MNLSNLHRKTQPSPLRRFRDDYDLRKRDLAEIATDECPGTLDYDRDIERYTRLIGLMEAGLLAPWDHRLEHLWGNLEDHGLYVLRNEMEHWYRRTTVAREDEATARGLMPEVA